MYYIKNIEKITVVLISCILLLTCATKSNAYKEVDKAVESSDFEAAIGTIQTSQESRRPIYSTKNAILHILDLGILEFYAGNYENSSRHLNRAERMIESAYTESISANFLSYIANDNTKDYPGEDFEDIYINVFNALNYYKKGDLEGALVEIRKLSMSSGKLDMLARRHLYKDPSSGASLDELVQKEAGNGTLPSGKPVEFNNSALARYLGGLFYLAIGNTDSARIEFEQLQRAFLTNKNVYQNPVPAAVEQARNVPAGKARLNIITFTGMSPVKEEEQITQFFPFFRHPALYIANFKLPKLVERPSIIDRIEVTIDDDETFELELLENIGTVIEETFAARYTNILIKTYIRTLLKYAAADIAAAEIAKTGGARGELAALAAVVAAKAALEATEGADIRMSRYLPSKAHIGGINLDPGTYDININFYSGRRLISNTEHKEYIVREKTLNLIDAISLN